MRKTLFSMLMLLACTWLHAQTVSTVPAQTYQGKYYTGLQSNPSDWMISKEVSMTLTPVKGSEGAYTISFGDMEFARRKLRHCVLPSVKLSMDDGTLSLPKQAVGIDEMMIDNLLSQSAVAEVNHDGNAALTDKNLRLTFKIRISDDHEPFYLVFVSDRVTTALRSLRNSTTSSVYHDLSGRRVNSPKKGVYIRDGRKVLMTR